MKKVKLKVNSFSSDDINLITKTFGLTEISANILLNRGLNTVEKINCFLNPKFKYFENPLNFKDLDLGCKRILKALTNHEKILVYGDYDVDGTTSISQFVLYLRAAGADVNYYVPDRESEGYGISDGFLNKLDKMQIDLLITVDCGISEVCAIDKINTLGLEVILIDHHQCGEIIPNAYAVINPKQKDCLSKNKNLCASGLSFKFLSHLNTYLKIDNIENTLLELACLGTIADIVELVNDNRIITYNGLKLINNTKLIGLKKLIEVAGIKDKKIDAFHIGYIIAPRINAAGRMSSAKKAVELLLSEDEEVAESIANELESLNILRKETEQCIFNEAIKKIEDNFLYKKNIIVVSGENWHEGVLGIVASRITEKYGKPTIVISVKGEIGKASARSLEYLDIYESLCTVDYLLDKFGGHKLAAGLTIKKSNINEFYNELNKYIDRIVNKDSVQKVICVDSYINVKNINYTLYEEIRRFEPYGHGNSKPLFAVVDFSIYNLKMVGKDKNHISFTIVDDNLSIKAIGFDKITILQKILLSPPSIIVSINENEFRGNKELQLILHDIEDFIYEKQDIDSNKIRIVNSVINKTKSKIIKTNIFDFANKISRLYNTEITVDNIICILENESNIEYILKNGILYIRK
ncbi:single-stranded-DNA-specific exonuclease RecJ [Sedimentibacter sp. zth1]|uniref:single-stranded-DNA-specific exonuclease RecJ n=1 Tax=Sedimentibacter sp. zth1 TaxID=2816908 RepID=UPI001A92AA70|nr:single-stranded-DNA-specific exonuclease RecJ [Sedimentibacter sp. zth1]QSX06331.1 single-stranded-DNA-specific exonuclease RecJ [Sedimentibacter sp. zth1]